MSQSLSEDEQLINHEDARAQASVATSPPAIPTKDPQKKADLHISAHKNLSTNKAELNTDVDESAEWKQQSTSADAELRPHPFIGLSLSIDDSIAENIISNAAHAFMDFSQVPPTAAESRETRNNWGTGTSENKHDEAEFQSEDLQHQRVVSVADALAFWSTKWKDVEVCDNTCPENTDGFCQDGRQANGQVGAFIYKLHLGTCSFSRLPHKIRQVTHEWETKFKWCMN